MAVRPDNRLLDEPLAPVRCDRCSAQVEVRKSSWAQTSVQWHADAVAACQERRTAVLHGPNSGYFEGCDALSDSIRRAAIDGAVLVPDEV
jgi:hypothetical protein